MIVFTILQSSQYCRFVSALRHLYTSFISITYNKIVVSKSNHGILHTDRIEALTATYNNKRKKHQCPIVDSRLPREAGCTWGWPGTAGVKTIPKGLYAKGIRRAAQHEFSLLKYFEQTFLRKFECPKLIYSLL